MGPLEAVLARIAAYSGRARRGPGEASSCRRKWPPRLSRDDKGAGPGVIEELGSIAQTRPQQSAGIGHALPQERPALVEDGGIRDRPATVDQARLDRQPQIQVQQAEENETPARMGQ